MRSMNKIAFLSGLVFLAVSGHSFAEDSQLKDKKFIEDSSYAIGVFMGKNIQQSLDSQKSLIKYDNSKILEGVKDTLTGKTTLSDEALQKQLQALDEQLTKATQVQLEKVAKENEQKGKEYRDKYAKQDGVKKTESGILYRIEKEGDGVRPNPADTVKVNYRGTLIDGTEFDSSYKRNQPIEFQLNQLIPGWVEGISLIKKGGKIQLVLPPNLAYGDQQTGQIPPNSTLIFDIELLDVKSNNK
ncbi:peptidylprolyl isomerase [Gallibacterium salpingitidis]|uniref:Peptidyl-prolyl cis-trans isomerase n=1 Tax=Gallibacterium salpingitidis TaxID=505341 RepID=A0A1A7NQC9_9PAST|nr:FKBP-type peptidyl-prolyl cis-trans isomerase [Gallibacterium salpingitidis]OBW91838.1 peptidylprolyl isomerase [Gallibacterium salpingitidis]OBX09840.1 peptidylprolyl isomerase [Gallibacterium salpingitidis]OBX10749.1 peptidylprolyl isomerase [Gallibacterium salpingitidis]WKS99208.1 FKBP-type peptidyl-prolyl cis-trans isomerase [Gallibacterium salpingitidis]